MTNPYTDSAPYDSAWDHGHEYGTQNPGSDQPSAPDFTSWAFDDQTTAYLGQVWQEGVLAGRDATAPGSPTGSTAGGTVGAAGADPHVEPASAAASGQSAIVDGSGQPIVYGPVHKVERAGAVSPAPHALTLAFEAALAGGSMLVPGAALLLEGIEAARALGCTVAFGISGDLALLCGLTGGAGVYITPSNEFGTYETLGGDLGYIAGGDASGAFTAVHGGSDALSGTAYAMAAGGGELVVGSIAVLFNADTHAFLGVAGTVGVGFGAPIAVYGQFTRTWVQPQGHL